MTFSAAILKLYTSSRLCSLLGLAALLLSLLTFYVVWSASLTLWKRHTRLQQGSLLTYGDGLRVEGTFPARQAVTGMFLTFLMGAVLGYVANDDLRTSRINTLYDVGIVAKHGKFDYTLRYHGNDYNTTFCSGYEPTFEAGERLEFLAYRDDGTCWNLGDREAGFRYYRDKVTGKAIKFEELP